MQELSKYELWVLRELVAKEQAKKENRFQRLHDKFMAGQKEFYQVGLGSSSLKGEVDRAQRELSVLNKLSDKLITLYNECKRGS